MSTHAIKTELTALLRELRPEKKWGKRTRALDLAEFALDNLSAASGEPGVRRGLELARTVRPRLRQV